MLKLRMVKFNTPVDVRGNNNSGCVAENGLVIVRTSNGDVIIEWPEGGGRPADQIIVGHANINHAKPLERIPLEPPAKSEPPAAKKAAS